MTSRRKAKTSPSDDLRRRLLGYFETLRIPLSADELDAVLAEAEKRRLSPLEFLERLIGPQADQRRQRAIERRIRNARFREVKTLEGFDWLFNAKAINRTQIETLATGEFIRRGDNLVVAGQSGVGKSHIVQSVGRAACVLGYRVCYVTNAALSSDLMASLAEVYIRMGRIDERTMELCEQVLNEQIDNALLQQAQCIGVLVEQSRVIDQNLLDFLR